MNFGLIKWFNDNEGYGVLIAINPINELVNKIGRASCRERV